MTFTYAPEDRLPDEKAVWREGDGLAPMGAPSDCQVSVDYGGGFTDKTYVSMARWHSVKKWRFGWPPSK